MKSVSSPVMPVSLDDVADDAVDLVRAFRDKGSVSFQDFSPAQARANYLLACQANGLPSEQVGGVSDHAFAVDGGNALLRLYRPQGAEADARLPLVVFIHGGGWVLGDLETHDTLCRHLCNRCGFALAAIDYRLAPEHPFPTPLDDCFHAIRWLAANAEALNIDASRVTVVGDSAGGGMAAVVALEADRLPQDVRVLAQVLLYPVTDLGSESASYRRIQSGFALTSDSMRWFRGHYVPPEADASRDIRLSPLVAAVRRQPPLFIVTVGHDPLCDEGIAYAAAAARGGTRVEHHHLPGHAHGIFTSAGRIATARDLLRSAAEFIVAANGRHRSHLRASDRS